jgi:hypothetical protein
MQLFRDKRSSLLDEKGKSFIRLYAGKMFSAKSFFQKGEILKNRKRKHFVFVFKTQDLDECLSITK